MKIYKILSKFLLAFMAMIIVTSCNRILEEEPFTVFTVAYFRTPQGLQDAINASYSGLRFIYGPIGGVSLSNAGTDEWTYGDQPRVGSGNDMLQLTSYNITTANGSILTPWNRSFQWINLCNAILEFAPEVTSLGEGARNTIMGEAAFLRAQYYFILVQHFGATPLNLGSGDLQFNQVPSTIFYRDNPEQLLVDNYEAMINDLIFATQNLPERRPADAFKLSKAAAFHLLAKVYIQRAYSSAAQPTDFQNAYDAATELINNPGQYGVSLLNDFAEVHLEGNDYNAEIIFSVERLPLNNSANENPNPESDFANKANLAHNMFNCDYTQPSFPGTGIRCIPNRVLEYGRPLRQIAPTPWLTQTLFADKTNDARFDGTFRTVWYAATLDEPGTAGYDDYVANLATIGLSIGDTAIYLAPSDAIATQLKATKPYFVIGPSEYYTNQNTTFNVYPVMRKYQSAQRANFNDNSGRPFPVSKFSETYLLAAEAAMQLGQTGTAATLINTLRNRAAFRPGLSTTELATRRANLQVDASDITLDFILDERSRELAGESMRWADLATRGKLLERTTAHNVDATNIQPFHVLRPIPQSQLNAISNPNPQQYQNPGY